ncbi:MAG: hypothetical protein ACFFA7_18850, partial [Promethearchaeota archaeon]
MSVAANADGSVATFENGGESPDCPDDGLPGRLDPDSDCDGLGDREEVEIRSLPCAVDSDGDGCNDGEEFALGWSTDAGFRPRNEFDVFDVPVPARADAEGANGVRNKVVDIGDVLAVLFYAFAEPSPLGTGVCGDNANANGVDYDCDKDRSGDPDGKDYDRTPGLSAAPGGVDPAGAPNMIVDIGDVLAALAQAFVVDCSAAP